MTKISVSLIFLFLAVTVYACGIRENIENRVNEKINETVDKSLLKIDSALDNTKTMLDTMGNKTFEGMDSVKYQLDSVSKEIKELIEKQEKLLKK